MLRLPYRAEEFLDDSVPDSPTADHVAAFADDNEFWIQEFGKVNRLFISIISESCAIGSEMYPINSRVS